MPARSSCPLRQPCRSASGISDGCGIGVEVSPPIAALMQNCLSFQRLCKIVSHSSPFRHCLLAISAELLLSAAGAISSSFVRILEELKSGFLIGRPRGWGKTDS